MRDPGEKAHQARDRDDRPADAARLQQNRVHLVDLGRHAGELGLHVRDLLLEHGQALAREDRAHDLEAAMTARRSPNERLAVLEQVSHMKAELGRMSAKVDEMHTILLQARGVRWAIIAVAGLVGFLAGLSHWVIARV